MQLSSILLLLTAAFAAAKTDLTKPHPAVVDLSQASALYEQRGQSLNKRAICILGICLGGTIDYNTDVNNCGSAGKRCALSWANGSGSQCVGGLCFPATCNAGFALNSATGQCQSVVADVNNCGAIGRVCALTGATANTCVSGTCVATACGSGFTLSSGVCNVRIDTTSDVNNCGVLGFKCPTTYLFGSGAKCVSGVCQPNSCNAGYAYNFQQQRCVNTLTDASNCGAVGNVCSFANGNGACTNGVCQITSCSSGFYNINGVCTSLNLLSDVNNCGRVGNVCSYANGVATCNNGNCQLASCNAGYKQNTDYYLLGLLGSSSACQAVDTTSDVNNCGAVGKVCSFPNGSGRCAAGVCTYSSCNAGFYNLNNQCTALNLQSDMNNCGAVGKVCSTPNGVATCQQGQCRLASCNAGYTVATGYVLLGLLGTTSACQAVDTSSDVNNCGALGKACAFSNGSGKCSNGVCQITSCNSGYYNVNGQCTSLNLQSDANNCGSVGKVCSIANGVAVCQNGQCKLGTCNDGYTVSTDYYLLGLLGSSSTCEAMNVQTDVNNCGRAGNKCAATYANGGAGQCVAGKCFTTCNAGFGWDSTSLYCRDTSSDANNCGAVGYICPATNGIAKCQSGKCQFASCSSGFKLVNGVCQAIDLQSDVNNCGAIGKICPSTYANGGASSCVAGVCQATCNSGFAFDGSLGFCRDVRTDRNNCGRVGNVCNLLGASANACNNGACIATACQSGYTLANGACTVMNLLTDVNNCGAVGNACQFSPTGATGACQNGKCVVTSCPLRYTLVNGVCVLSASQAARAKKSKIVEPRTLCPAHETACPIAGSASFAEASAHHFTATEQFSGIMAGSGGFECIDTKSQLDSCGGCASTGEGRDCTSIRGVKGVGCEAGSCIVFSCQAGWKPSLDGTKCVRAREHHVSSNHTAHHGGAKRHLHARHHVGASFHS
ncbi:hypothetical protein JCM11251_004545 [Rhodosporidiobolus azoricus]